MPMPFCAMVNHGVHIQIPHMFLLIDNDHVYIVTVVQAVVVYAEGFLHPSVDTVRLVKICGGIK